MRVHQRVTQLHCTFWSAAITQPAPGSFSFTFENCRWLSARTTTTCKGGQALVHIETCVKTHNSDAGSPSANKCSGWIGLGKCINLIYFVVCRIVSMVCPLWYNKTLLSPLLRQVAFRESMARETCWDLWVRQISTSCHVIRPHTRRDLSPAIRGGWGSRHRQLGPSIANWTPEADANSICFDHSFARIISMHQNRSSNSVESYRPRDLLLDSCEAKTRVVGVLLRQS